MNQEKKKISMSCFKKWGFKIVKITNNNNNNKKPVSTVSYAVGDSGECAETVKCQSNTTATTWNNHLCRHIATCWNVVLYCLHPTRLARGFSMPQRRGALNQPCQHEAPVYALAGADFFYHTVWEHTIYVLQWGVWSFHWKQVATWWKTKKKTFEK